MKNIRSTLATVWRIAAPYFRSEDKWAGRGLLAAVIAIELAIVGITVLINQWNARFYNALQDETGTISSTRSSILASWPRSSSCSRSTSSISINGCRSAGGSWMTKQYLGEWLHQANHYRMQLQGDAADNPDQRMTDDVKLFVEPDAQHRRRPAELDRHAGVLCRHPVGTCPTPRRCTCSARISRSPAIWSGAR